ncbi:M23 family metallopeptidase [Cyanobium sp. AMD-g]|nr:M23 family metallopeptidase [Cyanobium sp. AMD-g]
MAPPPPVGGEAPPATIRPGTAERRPEPVRRFDASLDALVREGVVTPGERVRVRGSLLSPQEAATRSKACRAGALSVQECNSGVIIIGRGRKDGLSDGLGEADLAAGGSGIGFGGFGLDASPLPPITVPVSALLTGAGGSFRLTDVFRVTPRPAPIGGNGNQRLLFPLIGSAVTTSGFGWRLHPVIGSWLMHAGRDLAAPEGTPVVAALSGRVVSSGLAGGYGLAVEIEHDRPRRRTLYGHLSELYVKDGEMVRQGEVIGRVGSTGLSTGPHLHFELRLPQDGGWVATDPGDLDPGGSLLAGLAGPDGRGTTDAVALLMGQLIATLERPRSPLPLPGETLPLPAGRPSRG